MKIAKVTIEFEMHEGDVSVEKLRDLLNSYLGGSAIANIDVDDEESVDDNDADIITRQNMSHIDRLREFEKGLSPKQRVVWEYFKANPGKHVGEELRKNIPFLAPPGAISGVFRGVKRWNRLGGSDETCPFIRIDWSHEHACGVYRGLTRDEIAALNDNA